MIVTIGLAILTGKLIVFVDVLAMRKYFPSEVTSGSCRVAVVLVRETIVTDLSAAVSICVGARPVDFVSEKVNEVRDFPVKMNFPPTKPSAT